ncbi:hypothetical protein [Streptomyces sp. NPDC002573]|uniref:hypothetical protein n=1 Tax=Streptomyces sp. NPDC002573 TaxID=3364651 RepID=UPI00369F600A
MTSMTERPTTNSTEPSSSFEDLLDLLEELNVPDGYKAEIIRGNIGVSPWSKGYYTRVMKLVCAQLEPYLPEGHIIGRPPPVRLSGLSSVRTDRISTPLTSRRTKRPATTWTEKVSPSSPS